MTRRHTPLRWYGREAPTCAGKLAHNLDTPHAASLLHVRQESGIQRVIRHLVREGKGGSSRPPGPGAASGFDARTHPGG
jgi:hypothetical protein